MTCSALNLTNIDKVWGMLVDFYYQALDEKVFHSKRAQQNRDWMHQLVNEMLLLKLSGNPSVDALVPSLEQSVESQEMTPYAAARKLLSKCKGCRTMRFHALDKLVNLHDDYTRQFKIDNLQLLLIQRFGELFLIEAHCPHRGHPLAGASIETGCIECPIHLFRFSLRDGSVQKSTEEDCRRLRTFELVYEGNEVGVMVSEEAQFYQP